jgi:hypothetical protein
MRVMTWMEDFTLWLVKPGPAGLLLPLIDNVQYDSAGMRRRQP